MKKIFLTITTVLLSLSLFAQGESTVRGTVLDPDTREGEVGAILQFYDSGHEKPIAFTTVAADGTFSQRLSGKGDYRVVVSNLGRKDLEKHFTIEKPGSTVDLGTLVMVTDAQQLEAAAVTAQKVLVKMDVDKMTYQVSEDNDAKASTVLDMLRKVPMVTVDGQDNITVNGSSSFLVTVDGKPNKMLSQNASTAFKMMPASAVESIEVITNPGVKYDAEGVGGVLNLTTSRAGGGSSTISDGQYGSIRLQTGNRDHGAGGMITMQRGKFSFSLNANGGYMTQKGVEYESLLTGEGFNNLTTSTADMRSPMFMGDASLSYEIDSLNLVTASLGGMFFGMKQDSQGAAFTLLPGAADYTPLYTSETGMKQPFNNFHADVDWQRTFAGHPGRMLTFSYRLNGSPASVSSYNTYDPALIMPSERMDGKTSATDHTFQGDFTFPISEKAGTLSTGVKFIYRKNSSGQDVFIRTYPDTDYIYNMGRSTDYDYYNRIGAAYAEYSGSFGKWGVKAGGRYEYTWQDVEWEQGSGEDFSTDYGAFVPTASLQYNLGMMQNIGLSYNMRISRPGITYLNPYVNQSDPTHWSFGNPDIDVEKTHNLSLVYNLYSPVFMLNATLTHSRSGNGISEYSFVEDNILKTTYGNILEQNATGGRLFFNVNIGKKHRIYANAGVSYTDARNDQMGYSYNAWFGNIFAGGQQTLPWDLQLSEGLIYNSKDYNLQGWSSGFTGCYAALTKTFLDDKLSVSLQGFTHLSGGSKMKFEMYSAGNGYESMTTVRVPVRQLTLSLSWTFGKAGVSVKKAARSIENEDVLEKSSGTATGTGMGTGMGM